MRLASPPTSTLLHLHPPSLLSCLCCWLFTSRLKSIYQPNAFSITRRADGDNYAGPRDPFASRVQMFCTHLGWRSPGTTEIMGRNQADKASAASIDTKMIHRRRQKAWQSRFFTRPDLKRRRKKKKKKLRASFFPLLSLWTNKWVGRRAISYLCASGVTHEYVVAVHCADIVRQLVCREGPGLLCACFCFLYIWSPEKCQKCRNYFFWVCHHQRCRRQRIGRLCHYT